MVEIKKRKHYGKIQYYAYAYTLYNERKQIVSSSKKGVIEKLEELNRLKTLGIDEKSISFGTFVYQHLINVHFAELKTSTKERYMSSFNNHIANEKIASISMKKLTVELLQDWYNEVYENKGRSVLLGIDRIVRPCLAYAFLNGNIRKDYAKILKIKSESIEERLKKLSKANVKPLTLEEQFRFIKGIEGDKWEVLYRMALDGGFRKGELLALTWQDIDFERRRIRINKTYSYVKDPLAEEMKYKVEITTPKTPKSIRTNRIPNVLFNLLVKHRFEQEKTLKTFGIEQKPNSLVFSTALGTYLDQSNVTKHLKKIYSNLSINKNKNFHDLRHTYATRQFELGTPVPVVSALLGHSSVNETIKTYIHILDDLKEATVDATDHLYDNIIKNT